MDMGITKKFDEPILHKVGNTYILEAIQENLLVSTTKVVSAWIDLLQAVEFSAYSCKRVKYQDHSELPCFTSVSKYMQYCETGLF
jgi:hypothetical protein